MKLYVLRHEKRDKTPEYFTKLTEEGLFNSLNTLPQDLKEYNIDIIYSSPYLRCLETIEPFSKQNNKLINVELGLCESHLQINIKDIENTKKQFNYNSNYVSIVSENDINNGASNIYSMVYRVKKMLNNIIEQYKNTNNNIILVTHMAIINILFHLINNTPNFDIGEYRQTGYIYQLIV